MQICIEVKGKFYHYVQSSKSRRQKKIIREQAKENEELQFKKSELRDMRFEELDAKLDLFASMKEDLSNYTDKLHKLYEKGLINEEGDLMHNTEIDKEQEDESKS